MSGLPSRGCRCRRRIRPRPPRGISGLSAEHRRAVRSGGSYLYQGDWHSAEPRGVRCHRADRRHKRQLRCRRLVLCTGGTDHPRRLNIPGEDLPHVSHYFQDPHPYFRKRLLVVGGKNSAIETALRCHHAGANVTLSYRREQLDPKSIKYWLLPEINGLIADGRITGLFNTVPIEITPKDVVLGPPKVAASDEGAVPQVVPNPLRCPADFVLLQIGYEQDTTLFELAGP